MIAHKPELPEISGEDFSIVLIGDFNPKIYQPSWFASQGFMRESEAESANVEMIHADFTSFSTDWFVMQVAREKFTLKVNSSAYSSHLRDLVLGTFYKLSHTPLSQMGVNYGTRLRFKTALDWHCFGHFLVPKSPFTGILVNPGMRAFAVEGMRPDAIPGFIVIMADPVPNAPNEAMLRVNDHCQRPSVGKSEGAEFFLNVIERNYDIFMNRSEKLINELIKKYASQTSFDDGKP